MTPRERDSNMVNKEGSTEIVNLLTPVAGSRGRTWPYWSYSEMHFALKVFFFLKQSTDTRRIES